MPPPSVKLKPEQPQRYFLGIDGTVSLDTVVWGHLWNAKFNWRNLLWDLKKDPTDDQRRVDSQHPKLPIVRLKRTFRKIDFADTCILPQGIDGKGVDKLWSGRTAADNTNEMDATCNFMQTFILNPRVNSSTSSLGDAGSGPVADVIYISSHGSSIGTMVGEQSSTDIFDTTIALKGGQFNGPKWVLLSNCFTLNPNTHGDWIQLMGHPTNPLRGVVGFSNTCPLAPGSAIIFQNFIEHLSLGRSFLKSWQLAMTASNLKDRWVVLCHPNAENDTISQINANSLQAIPNGSNIRVFDETHQSGVTAKVPSDPFEAFWTKNNIRITPANRNIESNKLKVGDSVTITVKALTATFNDREHVDVTLVYIRMDYPNANIDINTMFTIASTLGVNVPTTANLNLESPGKDDSWRLVVNGTPAEITITLKCKDLSALPHENYALWLLVKNINTEHRFIRNGAILVKL